MSIQEQLNDFNRALRAGGWYLHCLRTAEKGRILVADAQVKQGQILLSAKPLHRVAPTSNPMYAKVCQLCFENSTALPEDPIWYFAAICSLTERQAARKYAGSCGEILVSDSQQQNMLMLHHPEPSSDGAEGFGILVAEFVEDTSVTPAVLQKLYHVWWFNSFASGQWLPNGNPGSSGALNLYWLPALVSHSCFPVAFHEFCGEDEELQVRALGLIEPGEEVTISYLSGAELKLSTKERCRILRGSKHFVCSCSRCRSEGSTGSKARQRRLRRQHIKSLEEKFAAVSALILAS